MNKVNNVLIVITEVVLGIGLFFTPVLGLLFSLTAVMWILGFSFFTENFENDRSRAIAILLLKTSYLAFNATINCIPSKSVFGFIMLILMAFELVCELIFCRMTPTQKKSNEAKQRAEESQMVIELRYASYLLGNKDMLFGEDQTAKTIRGLAISAVTFIATLVSAISAFLIGQGFAANGQGMYLFVITFLYLCMCILFYQLLDAVDCKNAKRVILAAYLSLFVILLFFAPLVKKDEILGRASGIYLYMYLFGCGNVAHAITACTKISNTFLNVKGL